MQLKSAWSPRVFSQDREVKPAGTWKMTLMVTSATNLRLVNLMTPSDLTKLATSQTSLKVKTSLSLKLLMTKLQSSNVKKEKEMEKETEVVKEAKVVKAARVVMVDKEVKNTKKEEKDSVKSKVPSTHLLTVESPKEK
jgi:hypothetical protein